MENITRFRVDPVNSRPVSIEDCIEHDDNELQVLSQVLNHKYLFPTDQPFDLTLLLFLNTI